MTQNAGYLHEKDTPCALSQSSEHMISACQEGEGSRYWVQPYRWRFNYTYRIKPNENSGNKSSGKLPGLAVM